MRMEDEEGGGVYLLSLSVVLGCFFSLLDRIYFVFAVMDREKERRGGRRERGRQEREGGGRDDEGGEKRERKWPTGDGG